SSEAAEAAYTDEERVLNDSALNRSLASQDALQLDDGYADRDMPYDVQVRKRKRKRRVLLCMAMCLLLGIIVMTSFLASNKNKKNNSRNVTVGDGSGVAGVEDGSLSQVAPTDAPPVSITAAPSVAATTAAPVPGPTDAPTDAVTTTESAALATLGPVVYDSSLLMDPTTPEGEAYADVVAQGLTDPQEIVQKYSLLTFFHASNGDGWVQKNGWKSQAAEECSWHGVACDASGNVVSLSLSNNRLIGVIPHDVCLMTSMQHFIVPANDLIGALPDCFGDMTNLQELHVTGNFLDSLPTMLYSLPNLTRLSLASNNFRGNMRSLFNGAQEGEPIFPQLRTLDLHSNRISGRVPDGKLATISTLKALNIANNPDTFGSLTSVCSDVRLYLASADCDVECTCCVGYDSC
ncbi:MAG: hypothetical protein SGILL_010441, partial [Bacillariaceae sp.]